MAPLRPGRVNHTKEMFRKPTFSFYNQCIWDIKTTFFLPYFNFDRSDHEYPTMGKQT